jgi:indole-3-glycerol phosphate synthase
MIQSSFLDKMRELTLVRNQQKQDLLPLEKLKTLALRAQRTPFLFEKVFRGNNSPKIIAEIKKSSPSQGELNFEIVPTVLAGEYHHAGATAISVLTEPSYFGGSVDDLKRIRELHPELVLLQKDFVIDPYQIYEAKVLGADAVLLIVAMLGEEQTMEFKELATSLGLSCLVEVHNLEELKIALKVDAKIIGINNRNLHTLKISLDVSRELAALIPKGVIAITESGINVSGEINELHRLGFEGFLIGSSLMKTSSPSKQLSLLIEGIANES